MLGEWASIHSIATHREGMLACVQNWSTLAVTNAAVGYEDRKLAPILDAIDVPYCSWLTVTFNVRKLTGLPIPWRMTRGMANLDAPCTTDTDRLPTMDMKSNNDNCCSSTSVKTSLKFSPTWVMLVVSSCHFRLEFYILKRFPYPS